MTLDQPTPTLCLPPSLPGEDHGAPAPKPSAASLANALRGRRDQRVLSPGQPILLLPSVANDVRDDNPARATSVDITLMVDIGELDHDRRRCRR
ncbi:MULTISPECIES: hypothetical protein [unclassified Thiocapsa]|uniref:hypothetical protein n=1 Tax=unclassified Thiocapsa TaxID=2641286 RepID=UPI0035B00434